MFSTLSDDRARQLLQGGDFETLAIHATALQHQKSPNTSAIVLECVALACATLGSYADAMSLFERLCDQDPSNLSYRINLGVLLLRSGNYSAAHKRLLECDARSPGNVLINFNMGLAQFALGEFGEAAHALSAVLEVKPEDDTARVYLARCFNEFGDLESAESLITDRTFEDLLEPRDRYELSQVFLATGNVTSAQRLLEKILHDDPEDAAARLSMANLMERANRIDDAQSHLDLLKTTNSELQPHKLLLQGKLYAAAGRHEESIQAYDQVRALDEVKAVGFARQRFLGDLAFARAHSLDNQALFDAAYQEFAEGNHRLREYFQAQRGDRSARPIPGVEDWPPLDAALTKAGRSDIDREQPIFIVGFPRSGTTLLDQLLDAHPLLQVMEEKPALEAVVAQISRSSDTHLDALLHAESALFKSWIKDYWHHVSRSVDRTPGTRLVDKYPLNLTRLHVAMCLFPEAHWIFAVRHPCDVVLSCFMQNFRYTEATEGFWSLRQTAENYVKTIKRWFAQRDRLRPKCLDVRYEDLIEDVEGVARQILGFLEVDWNDSVLGYRAHAKTRHINTPSYNQVVQPIYRNAVGRWHNYRKWFGEAEAILAPMIKKLGYAEASSSGIDSSSSGR